MRKAKLIVSRVLFSILGLLLLLIVVIRISCPTAIRLDCGDIRYTALLIPVWIDRTPEPQRSVLLSLARDAGVPPEWGVIPLQTTSNYNAGAYRDYYEEVAVWAAVDRRLSLCLLQDVSGNIRAAGTKYAVPSAVRLLRGVEPDRVAPTDWADYPELREDPGIRSFLAKYGYVLPPMKTAASASRDAQTTRP